MFPSDQRGRKRGTEREDR
jgi:hypothetical protein